MATIYALGLKLSDILEIKLSDLDLEKRLILIPPSKTDKGRRLKIPAKLLPILNAYFEKHKPVDLLFVGEKGKPYSPRSVQLVFQQALQKAKIEKSATVHTLRHSYAVHCMERGIDIHLLKEILGHKYLQTTSIYYQIANIDLANIRSPFEDLEI